MLFSNDDHEEESKQFLIRSQSGRIDNFKNKTDRENGRNFQLSKTHIVIFDEFLNEFRFEYGKTYTNDQYSNILKFYKGKNESIVFLIHINRCYPNEFVEIDNILTNLRSIKLSISTHTLYHPSHFFNHKIPFNDLDVSDFDIKDISNEIFTSFFQ